MTVRSTMLAAAAIGAAVMTAAPASANFILVGGTSGDIPSGAANDLLAPLGLSDPLSGTFGAQIESDGKHTLKYDFLGYEAGFDNRFNSGDPILVGDGNFANSDTAGTLNVGSFGAPLESFTTAAINGLLDFEFLANNGAAGSVANGSNPDDSGGGAGVNFFTHELSDGSILLFLDDAGAGPDDNHDDMVVRISQVPEPGTLALIGAGLLGLGFGVRRRRREAA